VNHTRVSGSYRIRPAAPAQHRVLVPEHQQLGILSQVPAEHQDGEGGYKADYQVDDLERHPAKPTITASRPQVTGPDQPRNRVSERHRIS
jgi:hypothetical protein